MNWRKFIALITIGLTGAAGLAFTSFLGGLLACVFEPWVFWGLGISGVIALTGVATIFGMNYQTEVSK